MTYLVECKMGSNPIQGTVQCTCSLVFITILFNLPFCFKSKFAFVSFSPTMYCTLYLRYGRQSDTGAFVGIVHELVQVFHELKQ